MIEKTCPTCGKTFKAHQQRVKFCSIHCGKLRQIQRMCSCGVEFKTTPGENRKFCSMQCSGRASKGRVHTIETKTKISEKLKGKKKTKQCVICGVEFIPVKAETTCSGTCFKESRTRAGKKAKGGFRIRGGRGKQGRFEGIFFNSTWELAFYLYHRDHGSDVQRNTQGIPYEHDGKSFKFYPDFILNGELVEVKGPQDPKAVSKEKTGVRFIRENELETTIFPYVKEIYGNIDGLHRLYGARDEI